MTEETQKYLPANTAEAPIAPFGSVRGFETAQRVAKALMSSDIVPAQFRENIGNCLIAMELAARTGSSILAIMQSLYVIHGRPGWSGAYSIAALNQSGRFVEPVHFEFQGSEGRDDWGCRAVATSKSGKEIRGPLVTIKIAKAEGWYNRNGSKWQTMPELMLRYRAASWFARTEAPELLMGMQTVEELADLGEAQETPIKSVSLDSLKAQPVTDDVPRGTSEEEPGQTLDELLGPEEAAAEPPSSWWPKLTPDGQFYDSAGVIFDPAVHVDPHSLTADYAFRAKKGKAVTATELRDAARARQEAAASDDEAGQSDAMGAAPEGPEDRAGSPNSDAGTESEDLRRGPAQPSLSQDADVPGWD